jgi:glycosyltransferase involved in cell wall biosynthesis
MQMIKYSSKQLPTVDIALATYNGERFLPMFLDSLVRQSYVNLRLVVSDDRSSDATMGAVRSYADRIDICIVDEHPRMGVVKNFEHALQACSANYVVLADQDDVWHADKIRLLLTRMLDEEVKVGSTVPILTFSDLSLVDEKGKLLASSFFRATLKSPYAHHPMDFAFCNHIPGCATMLNRPLLDLALPFPPTPAHDWWINLVAVSAGQLSYVGTPLVDYRQHECNAIGIYNALDTWYMKLWPFVCHIRKAIDQRRRRARAISGAAQALMLALAPRLAGRYRSAKLFDYLARLRTCGRLTLCLHLLSAQTGMRLIDMVLSAWYFRRGSLEVFTSRIES